jgi:superoxide reductase
MDRRAFLQTALTGSAIVGIAGPAAAARYFPVQVDQTLFEGINRVKDPAKKSPLEKGHVPVILAPTMVKADESFMVVVSVGENLHPMGPTHWIEYIDLYIGNEPTGRAELQSRGYLQPRVTFSVVLHKEQIPGGKVTLVARQHCNLHGLWEGSLDITVT